MTDSQTPFPPIPKSMPAADEALKLIRQRGEDYDSPDGERSMLKTVVAFNVITGRIPHEYLLDLMDRIQTDLPHSRTMIESDGWLFMQILKDVRQWTTDKYHRDSDVDCIAYNLLKSESLVNEHMGE